MTVKFFTRRVSIEMVSLMGKNSRQILKDFLRNNIK